LDNGIRPKGVTNDQLFELIDKHIEDDPIFLRLRLDQVAKETALAAQARIDSPSGSDTQGPSE
jgi:hypothetical protein